MREKSEKERVNCASVGQDQLTDHFENINKSTSGNTYQSKDNPNMFVVGVDMENRPVEDIAKDAAMQIIGLLDALVAKQEAKTETQSAQEAPCDDC